MFFFALKQRRKYQTGYWWL